MNRRMKWWGWGAKEKCADVSNMPAFWAFVEKQISISPEHSGKAAFEFEDIELSPVRESPDFIHALEQHIKADQISCEKLQRLEHTYGKSYRDLLRIRLQKKHVAPDYVIYPESHEEVEVIVRLASQYKVVIIPFGGGSNIVGAIERFAEEQRTVVSLDMMHMNRLLDIDPIAMTATFQTGVFGPELEEQLSQHGFALGHYPDSFEFSTLGGWLATRSAGMQSDRYGTIADMALSMKAVTAQGTLVTKTVPKASVGPDLNQIIMGSEGQYAVITEATMKVHPLPPVRAFRGVLFHNFDDGVQAIYQCVREGCLPNAIRFLDSRETQLSFSFKKPGSSIKTFIEKTLKTYLKKGKKFNFNECCLMILAFEGSKNEVTQKKRQVLSICRRFHGFDLGAKPGNQWYARKYDYPYLRDLLMNHGAMADVVETSIVWSKVLGFYDHVKQAIYSQLEQSNDPELVQQLMQRTHFPGYIGCHISHSYANGACLYFTFAAPQRAGYELEQYLAVKKAATDAVTQFGGSLSHHHSVGYEHKPWLADEITHTGMRALSGVKNALDPDNMMNPGKFISEE